MWEKPFKNHLKLLLILSITFLINACQKDDDLKLNLQTLSINQKEFKISKIGKSKINSNKKIVEQLTKLSNNIKSQKEQSQNKIVDALQHGFSINTDNVTYIQNADSTYHSYTFLIERDTITSYLENLLLSLQADGSYKTSIITYNITAQEKQDIKDGIFVDLTDKVSAIPINDQGLVIDIFSKVIYEDCEGYTVREWCTSGQHNDQTGYAECQPQYYNYERKYYNCETTGGTPQGTNDDTSNTDGTNQNTTGSSPDNTDVTSPTTECTKNCPEEFDETNQKNCEELHKFSTSPYSQNEFLSQENDVNESREKGFVLAHVTFNPGFNAHPIEANEDCSEIHFPVDGTVFGVMHTHPSGCVNGTLPMFFEGDLYTLYKMTQNFNATQPVNNSIFTVYMTVEGYHYAIKINDIDKLEDLGDVYANEEDLREFKEKYVKAMEHTNNTTTPTQNELAEAFLKFINQTYDLGISLYRSTHEDVNYDPNLPLDQQTSNWKQLILDENNNLDFTDC